MNFNVHEKLFLKFRKSIWKEDPNEVRCLTPMENWMKSLNEQKIEQIDYEHGTQKKIFHENIISNFFIIDS